MLLLLYFLMQIYQIHSQNQINSYNNYIEINESLNEFIEFTSYGNEIHQSHLYFSYIDNDHKALAKQVNSFKLFNHYLETSKKFDRNILISISTTYENITNISTSYSNSYSNDSYLKSIDCSYSTSLVNVKRVYRSSINRDDYQFHFIITETNCHSNLIIQSGSSFDAYAMTSKAIVSCNQYTIANSSYYNIYCFISSDNIILTNYIDNIFVCINLTVILSNINFDSFNEVRKTIDRMYYRILDNNKQYCYLSNQTNNYRSIISFNDVNYRYFTGEWTDSNSYDDINLYNYTLSYNQFTERYLKLQSLVTANYIKKFNQSLFINTASNTFKSFHLFIYSNQLKITLSYNNLTNYYNMLTDQRYHYYFFGSSHMRSTFDAISEYLYNDRVNDSINNFRKISNIHFYDPKNLIHSRFINLIVDNLNKTCHRLNKLNDNIKYTIIFQFGAWDLAYFPLAYVLIDKYTGIKLFDYIHKLLTGVISCGKLYHFVYITSVPIPHCLMNNSTYCAMRLGYRNNAAILSMNQFIIKKLVKINPISSIQLSIIDAYHIVKPRLLLDISNEVVCNLHYICGEVNSLKSDYDKVLLHTVAGDAVINTILHSLVYRLLY